MQHMLLLVLHGRHLGRLYIRKQFGESYQPEYAASSWFCFTKWWHSSLIFMWSGSITSISNISEPAPKPIWLKLALVHARTEAYKSSFLPATIKLWNQLHEDIKTSDSVQTFRCKLLGSDNRTPIYFCSGKCKYQIIHTQMGMKCSPLNEHLYQNRVRDSPTCQCGYITENVLHYFIQCSLFNNQRALCLNQFLHVPVYELLFGSYN